MQNLKEKSLELHKQSKGKLSVAVKVTIENADDLSLAYSPGVAEPCKAIYQDPQKFTIIRSKEMWLRSFLMVQPY